MQTSKRRELLFLMLILFWILFVLGGYYYYHKPINIEMIAPPFSALLDFVFVILFSGLAGGLGQRILRAEGIPTLERAALHYALGAGLISLIWLGLGVLGLYRFPLGAPLLILGCIVLRKEISGWYKSLGLIVNAYKESDRLEKFLAVLAAVLVLNQLVIALAPPIKWDALAYHLQLPRQYLAAGKLIFTPENPYWGHPQIVEMLNTFAMSFHRAQTAAALNWGAGVVFLLGLFGLTNTQLARLRMQRYLEPGFTAPAGTTNPRPAAAGWMAVTAVLAGTTFRYLLGWSYTDLFSALFGLAALITFFAWLDEQNPTWFLWTGLFCGFALGTKWTAGLLPAGLFLAALLFRKQGQLSLKTWFLAGGIAFLAITPWLVKNGIATGNPLYPYLWGTPWIDAARLASANQPPETIDWWQHLLVPFMTTWAGVDSMQGFGADLGPLLLLFAVPGFWLYRRCQKVQVLLILLILAGISLAAASLRFGHLIQTRLYYALLPAMALPCGWGWEWIQKQVLQGVRMRRILSAVVLLVMGLIFWQDSSWMAQLAPGRLILGAVTEQQYLENILGFNILAMQEVGKLPEGSRTLMLWEPRGLYAPLQAQADLWIDRWRTDRRELQTASAIFDRWKQEGFTHLLVYQQGIELIRPQPGQTPTADWSVLQEVLAQMPEPVSIGGFYLLYSLK